jgi:hypothetical protein
MDLLERYLQAVRFLLPKKQRDDVDRELSEDLRSQIEEKESELGRTLDQGELSALLKKFGHPIVLALRYQQDRYLIGPAVFPFYWLAVRFVLGTLALVHILLPVVYFVVTGDAGQIVGLFLRFPGVAVPVLAWTTAAFAVLDTAVVRSAIEQSLSRWSPESLPPLVNEESSKPPSALGLVGGALLSLWWLVGLQLPYLLLGPSADYVALGPIFHRLYFPMVAAAAAGVGLGWLRLSRPQDKRFHAAGRLVVDALGLVILYLLARGGDWVVAGERFARLPGHEGLLDLANLGAGVGLNVALLVAAVTFAWKYLTYARGGASWPRRPIPFR